jgi:hypothetical protein
MPHRLKSNIRFLDKSFQEDQTHLYILSLMYDGNGFTFNLFHSQQNRFIGFFNFPLPEESEAESPVQHLEKLLTHYQWLNSGFEKVNFLLNNPYSTLVPLALFDAEKSAKYLEFNLSEKAGYSVNFDLLKNISSANIYYSPEGLNEKVATVWPNSSYVHSGSSLLEILAINYKNLSNNKQVFVNVLEDRFELVYFKENKLHFYNSFKYKTKEDFIYFLLATLEQLKVNPEEAHLVLMGIIDKSGKLYEITYQYVRNIGFTERNENFGYSHVVDELQAHYYYTLFNVLQCG